MKLICPLFDSLLAKHKMNAYRESSAPLEFRVERSCCCPTLITTAKLNGGYCWLDKLRGRLLLEA
jgi:hypothetical protein